MKIALRTGAGRGAYELVGSQGVYKASDLFDKGLSYELTPNLVVPGRAVPDNRQGKPRIKLDDQRVTTHSQLWLAGLLLLPKPTRDFKKTSGGILITSEAYSMTAIKIDVVLIESNQSIVRPTEILLENFEGLRESINFVERMSRIIEVWRIASKDEQNSDLATLLKAHEKTIHTQDIDHKAIGQAAQNIFSYLNTNHDPLRKIESLLKIEPPGEVEEFSPIAPSADFGSEDTISPEIARIENIKQWRKVAVRGAAGIQFSAEIKRIYQDTCLFTGQRLPKLDSILSAGVDAAHILPWASYGLNSLDNGICLSKQCHWAFDSGVIKLSFDRSSKQYVISIPQIVYVEAKSFNFSLDAFQAIVGPIPSERLPANQNYWPKPDYVDNYNQIMFPILAGS